MSETKLIFDLKPDGDFIRITIKSQSTLFFNNNIDHSIVFKSKNGFGIRSKNAVQFVTKGLFLLGSNVISDTYNTDETELDKDYINNLLTALHDWAWNAPEFKDCPGSKHGLDYYLLSFEMGETEFEF